jgi:hypothetical protein
VEAEIIGRSRDIKRPKYVKKYIKQTWGLCSQVPESGSKIFLLHPRQDSQKEQIGDRSVSME